MVGQSSEPQKITNSDSCWGIRPKYRQFTFDYCAKIDDNICYRCDLSDIELIDFAPLDEEEENVKNSHQFRLIKNISNYNRLLHP